MSYDRSAPVVSMTFDRDKKYRSTSRGVEVTHADGSVEILPSAPWKQPVEEPQQWVNRLSYDQMIGMFCLFGVFVLSGFDLKLMAIIGGIWAIIVAWRWLYRVAPVTATIIFMIFGGILIELLRSGSRGGRRRW